MGVEFLFGSHGRVVGFRHGHNIYDLDLGWLGSAPWNDGDVFDPAGRYVGTITETGRLYEIEARRGLTSPPPCASGADLRPAPPAAREREPLPAGMRDIRPRLVVPPHEIGGGPASAAGQPGRTRSVPPATSSPEDPPPPETTLRVAGGGSRVAG